MGKLKPFEVKGTNWRTGQKVTTTVHAESKAKAVRILQEKHNYNLAGVTAKAGGV